MVLVLKPIPTGITVDIINHVCPPEEARPCRLLVSPDQADLNVVKGLRPLALRRVNNVIENCHNRFEGRTADSRRQYDISLRSQPPDGNLLIWRLCTEHSRTEEEEEDQRRI